MSKIDDVQPDLSALGLTADRTEIKYVMPADQAAGFIRSMAPLLARHRYHDSLVEPSPRAEHYATTVYFDTADSELYRAAVREPVHVKVRAREYYELRDRSQVVQPRPVTWLELKSRDGQRSRKRRACIAKLDVPRVLGELETPADDRVTPTGSADIDEMITELRAVRAVLRRPLRTSCIVNYRRLSWQDGAEALRVTLDSDVCAFAPSPDLWTDSGALTRAVLGRPAFEEPRCVLEVKSRGPLPPWLDHVLARHGAAEIEYSKFVMASRAVHGSL
jgi:hypothetical protein